ncbi:hypothetical protein GQ457_03G023550 [Hibiscus cannabinus]
MVSEVPSVVETLETSSLRFSASKPFTNKIIFIRLDESNYLLWRQYVLFAFDSLALSSHIDGTQSIPPQFVLVSGEKISNPRFASCRTTFEIWEKVQQNFSVSSTTKIMHLHCSLKNLRKQYQSMKEYLAQIQNVCDSLAACGNPLTETMHISTILSGLPSEHEPVVAIITSSPQPYKLDGIFGVLLDIEARLQETHSVSLVQGSNHGFNVFQQFNPVGPGPNPLGFSDQPYYGFIGQVSSSTPNGNQRFFQDANSLPQRGDQDSTVMFREVVRFPEDEEVVFSMPTSSDLPNINQVGAQLTSLSDRDDASSSLISLGSNVLHVKSFIESHTSPSEVPTSLDSSSCVHEELQNSSNTYLAVSSKPKVQSQISKQWFHPMLTRSKIGSLKPRVLLSSVTVSEVPEPKTVKHAFESAEQAEVVNKEYDALIQKQPLAINKFEIEAQEVFSKSRKRSEC